MSARLVLSESSKGGSVPGVSPSFLCFVGNIGHSLASAPSLLCLYIAFSICMCLFLCSDVLFYYFFFSINIFYFIFSQLFLLVGG